MVAIQYEGRRGVVVAEVSRSRLTQQEIDDISWHVLISLDAAWRGRASAAMVNRLLEHVLTAYELWGRGGNDVLVRRGAVAFRALYAACARYPDELLLAGKEYQDVRNALTAYLRQLETITAGELARAYRRALEKLNC